MWCLSLLASFRPAKLRSCLYSDPVSSLDPRDNTIRTGRFRSVLSTPRDTKSSNGAPLPPCRPSRADRLRGSCRQVPALRSTSACGCVGVATGPSHASRAAGHGVRFPSPPLDNIQVMVIVWRLRGNIIRTALS